MERINLLTEETATGGAVEILKDFKSKMGKIINIFKVMGNSTAAIKTYVSMTEALRDSTLSPAISEAIAIRTSANNGCEYCLAAHSYLAANILSEEEIISIRKGKSSDTKIQAALDFATAVMKSAGKVSDEEFEAIKKAGFTDGEILEIIANVTLTFYTNSINNVAQTKVDFPKPKE